MKGAGLTAFSGTLPANGNGAHRAPKKSGASRRAPAAVSLEPFAAIEPNAADAPMWPVHSTAWYQPQLAPSLPAWSGLAIERRHSLPSPGFLSLETVPFHGADALERSGGAVRAEPRPGPPPSGLEPLGWDPRIVSGKEPRK